MQDPGAATPSDRLDRLWRKHGRTFWVLHSLWALATGVVVIWLAHERYHFVYWVVGFLVFTWISTLAFDWSTSTGAEEPMSMRFRRGFASYLVRVMYQETLFFLLPFYAYSTVVPSWNVVFLGLLVALAVLACLDLVFDRWLRTHPAFGMLFFASVAFAAVNLLAPMLFSIDPATATPVAAGVAVATALPIALRLGLPSRRALLQTGAAALAIVGAAVWLPHLIPPVPLRLQEVRFAADIDRETLEPLRPVEDATADAANGSLVVVARVFAPTNVPARVSLEWYRGDELLRSSREVEIVAHGGGFRFWDVLRADAGALAPGAYRVVMRTAGDRAFGSAEVALR